MAVGILEIFDSSYDDSFNCKHLKANIDIFGSDCLEIAYSGDCQKFIASTCVQTLLDNEWYGEVTSKSGFATAVKVLCFRTNI